MMLNSSNASVSLVRSHVNLRGLFVCVDPLFPPGETACVFIRQEVFEQPKAVLLGNCFA